MGKPTFYDVHCHALTLSHPSFLAFIQTLRRRGLEEVYAQVTAPNYLIAALFFKAGERMRNLLSVMERDVGSIFKLMEDDLSGGFPQAEGETPLIRHGELALGSLRFGRVLLCPLIVDFQGAVYPHSQGAHYDSGGTKSLAAQVRDVLEGIRDYRQDRPEGFLEIRPFLGIDARHYSAQELELCLESAFEGYAKGSASSSAAFAAMRGYSASAPVPGSFAGIKVYPPLGFDPWPEGGAEREKLELLWAFCERLDLPVITHCDDQGFRVAGLEEAWRFSSPQRWEPVLRAHPGLRLDFAHFGAQYSHPIGRPANAEWSDRIVRLMVDFPKVYADLSFNGSESEYYRWLGAYLGRRSQALARHIEERLLFGSDFMVNLSKVRSYADYYRIFAEATLPDELKLRLCHDNPRRFLFEE